MCKIHGIILELLRNSFYNVHRNEKRNEHE